MRALQYAEFTGPLRVVDVPAPTPSPAGVVVRVGATGVCRSDWHGWQGHDPDIVLPHVPGHELAGTVEAVGPEVRNWLVGDRVTVPFVCACGTCPRCLDGDQQVCDHQSQPGFTHWGSFAELVALDNADVNLVALPDDMAFSTAAALGCRYSTSFRAVVHQGRVRPGEWVAVHGCGGVGLSAIQIAAAQGARVIAVDVSLGALELATSLGAEAAVDADGFDARSVAAVVRDRTDGGAHVSLDALGSRATCQGSVLSLRPRGRHVQVGLLPKGVVVPMQRVIAQELEIYGSHGMPAHAYPELLDLVSSGRLQPQLLVTREIALEEAAEALRTVGATPGITVITQFS
ncbi:MAG: zinc-dependent alcohol dehydrogenase family protein [Frankiaceae bacterium]|nr:zinc-dependent alcohol dehydrogenase family protein [Frankiaceae bacterium]